MKARFVLLAAVGLALSGCTTYRYRVVQPDTGAPTISSVPVTFHYDPLNYRMFRDHEHLAMNVDNPTDERIVLVGDKSFVVDPRGESHQIRSRVIAPHSFTWLLLPPIPMSYAYPAYWGYGPGWGWGYPGMWCDPFWGLGWWGPPPVAYYQVRTQYDWEWKTGPARLRLTYERAGKAFEHDFEIVREPDKK
jgi:hypothetical protein